MTGCSPTAAGARPRTGGGSPPRLRDGRSTLPRTVVHGVRFGAHCEGNSTPLRRAQPACQSPVELAKSDLPGLWSRRPRVRVPSLTPRPIAVGPAPSHPRLTMGLDPARPLKDLHRSVDATRVTSTSGGKHHPVPAGDRRAVVRTRGRARTCCVRERRGAAFAATPAFELGAPNHCGPPVYSRSEVHARAASKTILLCTCSSATASSTAPGRCPRVATRRSPALPMRSASWASG
jgi:hypothetical protein